MKIIVSGGGTGGHLFPAISVGEELLNRGHSVYLWTDNRCSKYLNSDLKISYKILNFQIFSNKIKTICSLSLCLIKSLWFLLKNRPNVVLGFGGYPTFPHLLAAIIFRIPIVIHEQNYSLGKTNRFFAKFALKIALSYQNDNLNSKYIFTGDIIRENIRNLPPKQFNETKTFHLLIFGGSQGASIFTQIVPQAMAIVAKNCSDVTLSITQQAAKNDQPELTDIYNSLNIQNNLAEFFYDMPANYAKVDLVISRSGASTIAELCSVGLPAIFVPYPHAAENHQFHNAKVLSDIGASWLISQHEFTSEILAQKIIAVINDCSSLKAASKIMLRRKNDGHKILADTVEKIIK